MSMYIDRQINRPTGLSQPREAGPVVEVQDLHRAQDDAACLTSELI